MERAYCDLSKNSKVGTASLLTNTEYWIGKSQLQENVNVYKLDRRSKC